MASQSISVWVGLVLLPRGDGGVWASRHGFGVGPVGAGYEAWGWERGEIVRSASAATEAAARSPPAPPRGPRVARCPFHPFARRRFTGGTGQWSAAPGSPCLGRCWRRCRKGWSGLFTPRSAVAAKRAREARLSYSAAAGTLSWLIETPAPAQEQEQEDRWRGRSPFVLSGHEIGGNAGYSSPEQSRRCGLALQSAAPVGRWSAAGPHSHWCARLYSNP
jgi:hypothetical protein